MIELDVEEYCKDCASFAAETKTLYGDNLDPIFIISCLNRDICGRVVSDLIKRITENEKGKSET